ncbi:FkbM family methyltransferase [Rhodobacterales bacterium HKCCE2091]|nr:FkbM family methyltransferase [Rhodobacterales bacterium HKCCE2091]
MGDFADRRRAVLTAGLRPSRAMRICDVGASPLSVPPYAGLLADGAAEVYGFEPNPAEFAKLAPGPRETYFPVAIGAGGPATLRVHPVAGFTSLRPLDAAALWQIGKEKWAARGVEEMPLDTVPLDAVDGLPPVDVLKMDLQGGEIDVLRGGRDRLARAVAVVTEVRFHRMYEGEALWGELDAELRGQGFKLHKLLFTKSVMMPHDHEAEVVRPRLTSQLLDGDAVYIRDGDLGALDDDGLAYLALAADAMFDSPDLALHCVDRLVARGRADADLPGRYIARFRSHQRAAPELTGELR